MMRNANTEIILSNTYHLMLTPGSELVEKMGGLQKFSGWGGPMLTGDFMQICIGIYIISYHIILYYI